MARTRQPQRPARIDWSNPLASLLGGLFTPTTGFINVASPGTVTLAAPGMTVGKSGVASTFNGSQYLLFRIPATTYPFTLFSLCASTSTSANSALSLQDGSNFSSISFRYDQAITVKVAQKSSGSGYTQSSGMSYAAGTEYSVAGVFRSATSRQIYLNNFPDTADTTNHSCSYTTFAVGCALSGDQLFGGSIPLAAFWRRELSQRELYELQLNPWQLFAPSRRVVVFGGAAGAATTDAAIAGTQATDVGAITAEATNAAAIAGTQATDVGAVTVEATTGCALAGTQAPDVGAVTVEATTGAALAGTQASDVAAVEVTAGTGTTDCAIAGVQAPDVGAIAVEATLGLALSATQASDLGYIVVEATLPAALAGTQDSDVAAITATTTLVVTDAAIGGTQASDVAAITVAGIGIWTDVGVSATTWNDVGGATSIWTDI